MDENICETLKLFLAALLSVGWMSCPYAVNPVPILCVFFLSPGAVSLAFLSATEQSSALRDMLYNPHLRDIVTGIDGARDPTAALKKAMAFPIFTEMADECLRVVAEHGKADELMYKPPPPNPLEALDLTV